MANLKQASSRFAVCINNTDYPASLELYKIYQVITDAIAERDGDFRIVDESGEDYLYPAELFVLTKLPEAVKRAILQTA